MTGAVDHDARADFWQRDKWPGCFDVAWHYVKDVPNAALRHIRLVESDRKPVTNARDAQEIAPNQARLVLNVFRNFKSQTSLLDDFEFYGAREKARADIRSGRGVRRGGTGGGAFPYAREKRNATPRNVSFRQKPGSRGASIFGGGGGVAFPYAAGPTAYPRGGVPYVAAPAPPAPFPFPAASAMSAVSAMSASAPAFAPVGLSRVALSARAGHAHPPRGAGDAGAPPPPGDPGLPRDPARPERAPEASPRAATAPPPPQSSHALSSCCTRSTARVRSTVPSHISSSAIALSATHHTPRPTRHAPHATPRTPRTTRAHTHARTHARAHTR